MSRAAPHVPPGTVLPEPSVPALRDDVFDPAATTLPGPDRTIATCALDGLFDDSLVELEPPDDVRRRRWDAASGAWVCDEASHVNTYEDACALEPRPVGAPFDFPREVTGDVPASPRFPWRVTVCAVAVVVAAGWLLS